MSVYVGKDVAITVQKPMEEDVTFKLLESLYFLGVQNGSTTHKACGQEAASEPSPGDAGWTELADAEYDKVWTSDDDRHSLTTTTNGNYALMLFRFKTGIDEADAKKIKLTFEGYGTAPGGNGVTVKVWNHVTSAWENAQSGTGSGDEELVITLTSNLSDYIDDNGFIYLLARTTNADDGVNHATLYCDVAKCLVTKAKFTVYKTPISDRDLDGVADEAAHVTVTKNVTAVTVSSVDDSTGEVTLASGDFDEGDEILCSYRYDVAPYVAQEIRIEPSREIQGIDGLGSEEIQLWALLQKEFTGSIREVFRQQAQLERLSVFSLGTVARYFSSEAEENEWEYVTGSNTLNIANGVLSIATGDVKTVYSFKPLPEIGDFKASVKIRFSTSNLGIPGFGFRYTDLNHYYFLTINGTFSATKLTMNLYKRDGGDNLLSRIYIPNVRDNQYYKLTVEAVDDKIRCKIDLGSKGVHVLSADDSSFDKGKIVLDARKKTIYYDDLRVTDKNRLDGYGIIVSWDDGAGHIRKIGFDNVTFPSGSLPTPKNEPVFVETPFKAESGVVIS